MSGHIFDKAPLPWVAADNCLFDAMSLPVMRPTPASPAPVAEVAKRVNAHDDLLAVAERLVAWADAGHDGPPIGPVVDAARTAIALARGGK